MRQSGLLIYFGQYKLSVLLLWLLLLFFVVFYSVMLFESTRCRLIFLCVICYVLFTSFSYVAALIAVSFSVSVGRTSCFFRVFLFGRVLGLHFVWMMMMMILHEHFSFHSFTHSLQSMFLLFKVMDLMYVCEKYSPLSRQCRYARLSAHHRIDLVYFVCLFLQFSREIHILYWLGWRCEFYIKLSR